LLPKACLSVNLKARLENMILPKSAKQSLWIFAESAKFSESFKQKVMFYINRFGAFFQLKNLLIARRFFNVLARP